MIGYWLLTGMAVLLIVALGIVANQRDKARTAVGLYRAALVRADPAEARAVAHLLPRGSW